MGTLSAVVIESAIYRTSLEYWNSCQWTSYEVIDREVERRGGFHEVRGELQYGECDRLQPCDDCLHVRSKSIGTFSITITMRRTKTLAFTDIFNLVPGRDSFEQRRIPSINRNIKQPV